MIGYINGIVSGFPKDACFLETGGIGYRIFISERTRSLLHIGEEARLLTYMAVREDAILLYGFPEQDEYDLFLILISVSKIGPKVAGCLCLRERIKKCDSSYETSGNRKENSRAAGCRAEGQGGKS